jgi:hypothetical protein
MASIRDHMLHSEIRIDAHVGARCQALAQSLETRKAIYLDFRFWLVREVWEGIRVRPEDRKLVHHLTCLVRTGRIFCPITAATFSELMKVRQRERREATIQAIDELSVGVTLMPEEDRVEAEVEDLVLGSVTPEPSKRPRRVWTRLPYVLGNILVVNTGFPPETEQAIQKAFFDHLWEQPLSAIAAKLDPERYDMQAEMTALAERLNEDNRARRAQMKSFESVLSDELSGAAELAEPALRRMIARVNRAATGRTDAPDGATDRTGLSLLRACLLSEYGHRMPTLHVHASLHALFRWEYRDKFLTANDMFDLAHAAAALAYCDAFFTERELASSVAHRRLGLDKHYDCFVTSRTAEAVNYLRSLV